MQSQSVVPPERLMMRGGHDRWSGEVLEEESSMVVDDPQSVLLRPEDPVEPEIEGQSRQTKATVNRKHDREKLKARGERKRLEKNRIENRKKFTAKIKLSGRRFFCRQCLFRTVIRYRARAHALKTCGKDSKQQNRMRKKVSIACALCPETFTTRMKLTEHHTARHNKGRICSECDKKFKTDQTLVRHLQHVHKKGGKEKKHKCTDCDYKSYLKADLKKHRGRRHLSGPATKPVGVNNADCISDEENERKNIWKISDFFLLNISGQKVQQLRLQEPQKVLRKTATIFVQFEVKNILSSKHFPNTVAVCGESSVTVLLFSPDGSLARQQDIPPSLLPSSPFTVLWVPGKMQLAALAPSTVTTVDFSDLDNVRTCNIYMVTGIPLLSAVTFGGEDQVFIATAAHRIYLGPEATSEGNCIYLDTELTDPENPLPVPVTSLHFSTTFGRLLVGCEDGDCFALDLGPDDNPVLEFKTEGAVQSWREVADVGAVLASVGPSQTPVLVTMDTHRVSCVSRSSATAMALDSPTSLLTLSADLVIEKIKIKITDSDILEMARSKIVGIVCDKCEIVTKDRNKMKLHTENMHVAKNENVYVCSRCSLVLNTLYEFTSHTRSCKFKCNSCSFTSPSKAKVESHTRKMHKFDHLF